MFVGRFGPTALTFGKDFFSISNFFLGHPVETISDFIGVLMLADEVDIEESFDDSLTTYFFTVWRHWPHCSLSPHQILFKQSTQLSGPLCLWQSFAIQSSTSALECSKSRFGGTI